MIIIRIITCILISLFLVIECPTYATTLPDADDFIRASTEGPISIDTLLTTIDNSTSSGLTSILALIYKIGILIALCTLAWMSVQFLFASSAQKAQVKESLTPYFIGLLFFVAGVPIAILIINIFIQIL